MIKKIIGLIWLPVICAVIFSGCSTIETTSRFNGRQLSASDSTPVAHVHADIWGIYIFNWPLITGSPNKIGDITFFKNTVTVNDVIAMVINESKELDATKIIDLQSDWDSAWKVWTLIFWVKEAQASCNAIK